MFRPFVTSKKAVRVVFNCGWACATRTGRGRGAAPNASVCDDTRRGAVMLTVIAVQHSCLSTEVGSTSRQLAEIGGLPHWERDRKRGGDVTTADSRAGVLT